MVKARIVITTYESDDDLHRCIHCLHAQSRKDFEVVIVNNSTKPIQNREMWSSYNWLTIIQSDTNSGFSGGSNQGARGACAQWIITLNPDAWPKPDWFANLMRAAEDFPEYAMLSSTLLQAYAPSILDGAGDCYSIFGLVWRAGQGRSFSLIPNHYQNVLSPCGAAAAYRRDVFESNAGFDIDFFCYLEDIDLGLRLQSQGYKCRHVVDACVLHVGGGSTQVNSEFQLYYTHKNQLRIIIKLTPAALLIFQLPLYCLVQTYLLIRTVKAPNWSSQVRGLWHGLISCPKVFLEDRPLAQKARRISTLEFARLISWSLSEVRNKAFRN